MCAAATLSAAILLSGCGGGGSSVPSIRDQSSSSAKIVSVTPSDGASSVAADSNLSITFSKPMNMMSVNSNFHIYKGETATGSPVQGTMTWNEAHTAMVFDPDSPMMSGATHTIHIGMGMTTESNGMMMNMGDGKMMTQDMLLHFKTQ